MAQKQNSRREFIKKLGIGAAALSMPGVFTRCAGPAEQPNILYIMTDDHAFQAISAYGSKINKTPNIDRLAKEGILFDKGFCSNSICAPSRAVMLTGKFSHINGHINNAVTFDGSQQTFPKLLQKAGYETGMFGKWHLKSDPTGFDYWNILPGQGHYYNPVFIDMGERKERKGYVTDLITDDCLDWIKNRESGKPFCALLHHKAPHRNWMPDKKHLDMYRDEDLPVPDNYFDDYETRTTAAEDQEMLVDGHTYMAYDLKLTPDNNPEDDTPRESQDRNMWNNTYGRMIEEEKADWDKAYGPENEEFRRTNPKGRELALWKYQRYIKDYLRCIASVDDNIGRVLDYLDSSGLAENTIVVYTSDQGFYLGEHGWFDKRFMYEESFRIPLMIRYPKEISPGVTNTELVQNIDFAPTFLDYASVSIPDDMQGKSLRKILSGNTPSDWREAVYYHYYEYPGPHAVKRHFGIRTHTHKLIHFYHDVDEWEMYDLENDPHEMNNLYGKPEYRSLQGQLKLQLAKLRVKYKDSFLDKYMPKSNVKTFHLAAGASLTLKYDYAPRYPGGGKEGLINGISAPKDVGSLPDYSVWQGYREVDLEAVIDLKNETAISKITTGYLQHAQSWIFPPLNVEYFVSNDGKVYNKVFEDSLCIKDRDYQILKHEVSTELKKISAQYIKVVAKNVGKCPDWHSSAGGRAWLFCDEIIVE